MNKLLILIILTLLSCNSNGQESFEGYIKFSTEISTTDLAPSGFLDQLKNKYGDSLIMYYSQTGDFKRVHINSAEFGTDSQFYIANKGKLFFTHTNSTHIDTLDVTQNSIKLVRKGKVENLKIIELECECYEYKATSNNIQNITLNYCFSTKSPKLNPELYSNHKDFYLNEYYDLAKRPYLKFSIETEEFKITYLATELTEKKIDKKIFELK